MELARRCTDIYGKINYQAMAEQLNGRDVRYVQKCFNDMKRYLVVYEKTGSFSPEEDAIIISRVQSGQCKQKMWANLAKELGGRNPSTVHSRWRQNLSKRLVAGGSVAAAAAVAIPTVAFVTIRSQVNLILRDWPKKRKIQISCRGKRHKLYRTRV